MSLPEARSRVKSQEPMTNTEMQSTTTRSPKQSSHKDKMIKILTVQNSYKTWENGRLQTTIAQLTRQTKRKDQRISRLHSILTDELESTKKLERMVERIGLDEQSAFEEIVKSNEQATADIEAAIEKTMLLINDILRVYPVEDYGEFAPLKDYIPTLVNALVEVNHVRGAELVHASSFFKKRHDELETCGLAAMLENMPAQFQIEEGNKAGEKAANENKEGERNEGNEVEQRKDEIEQKGNKLEEQKEEEDEDEKNKERPTLDWADMMNAEAEA